MRSHNLHTALEELVMVSATELQGEVAAGAEVPFDLEPHARRRGDAALYCYRALTDEFITARAEKIEQVAGYAETVSLLANFDGLDHYLLSTCGELPRMTPRRRAGAAIIVLLQDVFADQTDFELHPEKLRAALERLEYAARPSEEEVVVVATLHGMAITSAELPLARGLRIARPEALEGLPRVFAAATGSDGADHLIVAFTASEPDDPHEAAQGALAVYKDLLRALRLFGDGRVTLGPLAFVRVGTGAWTPRALSVRGRPHGMLVVTPEQEDELRAFCNLVSRRAPHGNALAWALQRFELGCERELPYEALSDHLLALRALIEPEGPGSGLLPGRLAALCATPTRRMELTERTIAALALERDFIAGTAVDHAAGRALVEEMANHLGALLRDVICGHLAPDLVVLADEILISPVDDDSAEQMIGDAGEAEEVLDLLF